MTFVGQSFQFLFAVGIFCLTIFGVFYIIFSSSDTAYSLNKEKMCNAFGYEKYSYGGHLSRAGWLDVSCYNEEYYCEGNDCVLRTKDFGFISHWEQEFYEKYGRPPSGGK